MTDNIVITHEIVDTTKKHKSKKGLMVIKLGMSEAFDSIKWSFLIKCLKTLRVCDYSYQLIDQCISSVSVLLTGSPSEKFWPS